MSVPLTWACDQDEALGPGSIVASMSVCKVARLDHLAPVAWTARWSSRRFFCLRMSQNHSDSTERLIPGELTVTCGT
eukprot:s482_g27.t1